GGRAAEPHGGAPSRNGRGAGRKGRLMGAVLIAVLAGTLSANTDSTAQVPTSLVTRIPGVVSEALEPRLRGWGSLVAPDKLEHASLSFTAGLIAGIGTREPGVALGASFTLGIGKELWDRRRTFFDPVDLAADLLGAAAAAALTRSRT